MNKCPFFVAEDVISPLMCESIIDECGFYEPDYDQYGKPIPFVRTCDTAQQMLYDKLDHIISAIEIYYSVEYKGMEPIAFEWYPQQTFGRVRCENGQRVDRKWVRTNTRDFTAVLFLTEYQHTVPFDDEYEVYGGKLEFPTYQFSFNPTRGSIVVFPSDPHFINATSLVLAGDAIQARLQIVCSTPFVYRPQDYQGSFSTWFA